jgi:NADPH:quinone reductase-like Zn-dependent oxidoreductase/acyl carrier protein
MAIASGSFSQYVTVDAAMVICQPAGLTSESAATIPVAFLTAYYSLFQLAHLQQGDRVLIHAAAGGVGLAAVQLAQQAGAEVFATASPSKWTVLQSMGVQHLFNSRNLDFAQQINNLTAGEGIDVIINSLAGDFIPASLSVLKSNGRFIELGKGIPSTLSQDVNYHQIDLVELCQQQPDLIQSMLQEIADQFQQKCLSPLPQTMFAATNAIAAFRFMQQAKQIGKVVISQSQQTDVDQFKGRAHDMSSEYSSHSIQPDATYLITGGVSGLGLRTAEWLVEQGAKHLVLVSRQAKKVAQIEAMEQTGVEVLVAAVDVTQKESVENLLHTIAETMPPLRGIIHAAGVLSDGTIQQMTSAKMAQVLRPKAIGAWHLHELTQSIPLDFFVLFSSATALLGSPGQVNHVAANTFLDTLAHYRRSLNQPALSINWGVWSEIGSAIQSASQLQQRGISTIPPQQGIESLAQLLQMGTIAQIGVVPIQWKQFLQQITPTAFFDDFTALQPSQSVVSDVDSDFLQQVYQTQPEQRRSLIEQFLRSQLAQVLGYQPKDIDPQKGFFDLGMDSLTAVELKNRLQTNLQCSLPATIIFDYPTLNDLTDYLTSDLTRRNNQQGYTQDDKPYRNLSETSALSEQAHHSIEPLSPSDSLDQLTQDQLADLLEQELSSLGQEKRS